MLKVCSVFSSIRDVKLEISLHNLVMVLELHLRSHNNFHLILDQVSLNLQDIENHCNDKEIIMQEIVYQIQPSSQLTLMPRVSLPLLSLISNESPHHKRHSTVLQHISSRLR